MFIQFLSKCFCEKKFVLVSFLKILDGKSGFKTFEPGLVGSSSSSRSFHTL